MDGLNVLERRKSFEKSEETGCHMRDGEEAVPEKVSNERGMRMSAGNISE